MTVRRVEDTVLLEAVCDVEDAESLIGEIQAGATQIDWMACTHLHAACLQVLLAARLPLHGTPANPALARWVLPLIHEAQTNSMQKGDKPATARTDED